MSSRILPLNLSVIEVSGVQHMAIRTVQSIAYLISVRAFHVPNPSLSIEGIYLTMAVQNWRPCLAWFFLACKRLMP